jgi:ABC-type glycerol-3-phosphate transport system substrate-binding protein
MIVTLRLWLPEELDPYNRETSTGVLARQLSSFSNTYPDLRVEVVVKKAQGRGGLLDFLRTSREVAPSVLPDLMVLDAADLETATTSNLIQPLDELLSSSLANDRFPFATAMGQVEDRTMGFVIGADMQHIAYRPLVFDSPIVTWTHVISAPSQFLFPAGGQDGGVNDATLIQYLAAEGRLTDPDGNPWLDRHAMVSVFEFYDSCIDSTVISPQVALSMSDADQAWERFQAGEGDIAVVRAGRYWPEADETLAAAPIPTQDGRPFGIARGWAITMVAEDPARQAVAMLLLDWLIALDHSAQWTQVEGYLPATHGALLLWDVSEADRAMLTATMEAAIPAPSADLMTQASQALQEALTALLTGQATPRRAAITGEQKLGR